MHRSPLSVALAALLALSPALLPLAVPLPAPVQPAPARQTEADQLVQQAVQQYETSQFCAALDTLQRALVIQREIGDRVGESTTLNNIGVVYNSLGQYPQALGFYQRALVIRRQVGDRAGEGITLNNIGYLLNLQKQPDLAIVFYKQSVSVTESIRQELRSLPRQQQESYTQTVASTYRDLADLLLQQDRILEAQQVLDLLKVQELQDYLFPSPNAQRV